MRTPRLVHRLRQRRERQLMLRARPTELARRRQRARRMGRARYWGMWAAIAAGAVLLLVGLPWLLWKGPYEIDGKYIDRRELAKGSAALVTGLRTAVVAFAAALGAGIALLYTARTYRLTRRGQITDRFTKALERLGSNEIYVRIGGILALEQIVQDAPEQAATDAARVLGHFIRHRAPRAQPTPDLYSSEPGGMPPGPSELPDEPAADVQAAVTALTRTESRTHVDPREPLDLHGLHLAGIRLVRADLTEANLFRATLTGADLSGVTLTDANLTGATLADADLSGATLTGAKLPRATLTDADLSGATLTGAKLSRATLTGADLSGVTLTDANLTRATLTDANLSGTTLTGANLSRAVLRGANLSRATLTGANLKTTDLSWAEGLVPEQVRSACTGQATKLPVLFENSEGTAGAS
ncbi:pentapeptide repeat-containing protein [Streptomyces sp. WI04-05B]|uniref:pentapeptide repeat-containing protein n=1 Tax=Streptomyces TaxID=1883 RepID=UPI0029B7CA42|nr:MULTISPECIES: pentapeptide repeat-containing protein [unclassified Streptomyces]MDX2545424.1 pentapeptide repeat-containing protein [Streptomyces sp. WI04-05B]MDX2581811.1 pentapeptide repeat-containing protein [Streptomyces sp. WI04-05A]